MFAGMGSARIAATSSSTAARDGVRVVPRHDDRVRGLRRCDAGRGGDALRREARAGLRQQAVDVPVVVAGELDDLVSRPVAARASRTAVIDASVPDETRRTISAEGTRSTTSAASSTSASVGAPKLVPRSAARCDRLDDRRDVRARGSAAPRSRRSRRSGCRRRPRSRRPRRTDEERLATDRAHRPHRAVDTARDQLLARARTARVSAYRTAVSLAIRSPLSLLPLRIVGSEVVEAHLLVLRRRVERRAIVAARGRTRPRRRRAPRRTPPSSARAPS